MHILYNTLLLFIDIVYTYTVKRLIIGDYLCGEIGEFLNSPKLVATK